MYLLHFDYAFVRLLGGSAFASAMDLLVTALSVGLKFGFPGSVSRMLMCALRNFPKSVRSSQRYAISRRSGVTEWPNHLRVGYGIGQRRVQTFALFVEVRRCRE